MSMQWIEAFVCIGGTRLITMYATLFTSTMLGIADAESDIVTASSSANSSLQSLVATTNSDIDYLPFVTTMASELQTSNIISKTCALNWLLMLHGKSPVHINKHLPLLLPQLLRTLSDADSSVVMLNIRVLAQVAPSIFSTPSLPLSHPFSCTCVCYPLHIFDPLRLYRSPWTAQCFMRSCKR